MAADQGPTTVGSIVAKLRMDRDEWIRDVAAVKQDARELEALRPDIHIDDNAAAVVTRMAAVKGATEAVAGASDKATTAQTKLTGAQTRLTAAVSAADSAYAKAGLAQMRLNELREKGVTSGSRYVAAEIAATEALKRLDAANDKVTASELALAAARDTNTNATVKANEANKTSVTRVGAIVTAIALLIPLLSPVGAAVVGLGGAFLGMGAAGILALIGIKREMDAGTQTGAAYRSGLDSLGDSFSRLAQTAAINMLSSFRQVVGETRTELPMLNTQVGQFSTLLGRSGATLFTGSISALRVLNPLFMTAGLYVQSLAEGFRRWSEGPGIEKFGDYALAAFPQVVDVLGKLATMLMHILTALAPLGAVGLAVLAGIADGINAIPVEILAQLIVTITWGAVAFKAWGFIAPMLASIATSMGAVGAATTIATGPIGWVVAGLAALAGVIAVVIASNEKAVATTHEYTAALDADSGALGRNVRAKAAQLLADKGALQMAEQLGIRKKDLVGYILGEADALSRVNERLDIFGKALGGETLKRIDESGLSMQEFLDTTQGLGEVLNEQAGLLSADAQYWRDVAEATDEATRSSRAQQDADLAIAQSLGISTDALRAARTSQEDMKGATEKATAQMYLQGDAAGLLRQALDQLNGKQIDVEQAQNRFDSSLANMGAHIDKTGKDVNRATTSLEGMSAAAVANRGELISSTEAAFAAAQAYRDQGMSSEDTRQKLADMRQAIIDHAISLGEDSAQVQAFIDKIYQIPATIPPTKVEVDDAAAKATLDNLSRTRSVLLNVVTAYPNGKPLSDQQIANQYGIGGGANGGTFRGLANGGGTVTGPGNAHSDTAGIYKLANGEEVISNRFGQADRFRGLLKQVNAGVTSPTAAGVTRGAEPTLTAPAATAATVVKVSVNVTTVQNEDPQVLGNIVGRGVKDALRGAGVAL